MNSLVPAPARYVLPDVRAEHLLECSSTCCSSSTSISLCTTLLMLGALRGDLQREGDMLLTCVCKRPGTSSTTHTLRNTATVSSVFGGHRRTRHFLRDSGCFNTWLEGLSERRSSVQSPRPSSSFFENHRWTGVSRSARDGDGWDRAAAGRTVSSVCRDERSRRITRIRSSSSVGIGIVRR